jgi:beta-lactamase regulating signal transducer with metallopeptidase domain
MNGLGAVLVGAVARGTVVAALGVALAVAVRRRGPATVSLVAASSLMVLVVVSGLALVPGARWWTVRTVRAEAVAPAPESKPRDEAPPRPVAAPGPAVARPAPTPGADPWLVEFARALGQELRRPVVDDGDDRRPSWLDRAAVALVAGMAIGLARLLLGLLAVRALRRRARPVADAALLGELDRLRIAMGCPRPVAALESDEVATPATLGWRRPAVLLPPSWRTWDEGERRAVLAHEMAHVCRGDYPVGLAAQISLAMHFYHPLAHWLASRLRLQQELAADAWGAVLSGGHRPYLTALARMALRQDDRSDPWPARAFLSNRGTFLRRIEMLRDPDRIRHASPSRRARALTIAALAVAGLLVSGFRGPEAPSPALAQAKAQDAPKPAPGDYDLSYVPGDTIFLIAVRPAELLARPEYAPLAQSIGQDTWDGPGRFPVPVDQIEQALACWLHDPTFLEGPPGKKPITGKRGVSVFRTARPQDWKAVAAGALGGPEEVRFEGRTYLRSTRPPLKLCYFAPDDRTLIAAGEGEIKALIRRGPTPKAEHAWDAAWKGVDKGQFAIAADSSWLRDLCGPEGLTKGHDDDPAAHPLSAFSPLWEKTRAYAVGVRADDKLKVEALATCGSADDARAVGETSRAALTLVRNVIKSSLDRAAAAPKGETAEGLILRNLVSPVLASARVEVRDDGDRSSVRFSSATDVKPAEVIKALQPAAQASREAARRAQSVNNMKMLGLALHNYHQVHDHFPPAVLYGPDGKTPYSWRVAILPYIEQQEIYNQYNFNEPWDGPNNRKLLDKIPSFLRAPGAGGDPTHTTYFAPTGPDTIFSGKGGTTAAKILDGTSNTIMIVEAARDIPWTKPEDIPIDIEGALPKFGGIFADGFDVLFADGSVKFLKASINPATLKALFTRAGGEVINRDESR